MFLGKNPWLQILDLDNQFQKGLYLSADGMWWLAKGDSPHVFSLASGSVVVQTLAPEK